VEHLLRGKVAAVTGAGWRIGRAASLAFAGQGARIVAADLDLAAAEATAAQVREQGGEAIAFAGDAADPAGADALVAAAVGAFGRLDILLNNTGVAIRPKGSKPSGREAPRGEAGIARFFTAKVDGLEHACRAAIRRFEAQGGGGAIVITDLIARLTDFGNVRYDPGHSAVATLTRKLALEAAEHGIRVNAFCPAGMSSTSASQGDRPGDEDTDDPANPLGQPITPEACAAAAMFLASDLAATITGVVLPVDGGLAAATAARR
jgi:NAD(P)-dependent dehydrogenase (short-subunit alcohol dehydrogenase family)